MSFFGPVQKVFCFDQKAGPAQNSFGHVEGEVELVSKELNHFGVIAGLFRQIGGHSSRFVLFCSF